ncbi:MAG: PEP-CTERM sorting domain-containing protein [Candidatus Rokubacteria bacterium]|nr:PEP-CTERM sorting domain-containing protein [Candidatus Rokubacteria bacterium]
MLLGVSSGYSHAATVVVDPLNPNGWAFQVTSADGIGAFVGGPGTPPLGSGSARLFTGTHGDDSAQIRTPTYNGVSLSSLTQLAYSTHVTSWNGQQAPYIILNVDLDANGSVDDLLFFEPAYQNPVDGNPALPNQGTASTGVWQTWDALSGGWWSLNSIAGATPGTGVKSLGDYLAVESGAMLSTTALGAVRLVTGFASAPDVFDGNVDKFVIAVSGSETIYDFEAAAPVPEPTTLLLWGTTAVGLAAVRRWRNRRAV